LILHAGLTIIRSSASYLIGESPADDVVQRVKAAVEAEFPQLEGIHHLHVHNYGEHSEVTAHLKVPGAMRVDQAHEIATRVEELMTKEFEGDVTIHVEPENMVRTEATDPSRADYFKFLGTGGARFVVAKQLRASGGIFLNFREKNDT